MSAATGRQFGVITSIDGTTVTGCVLNQITTGTSAQKAEARDEKGKVTDTWYYSKSKTISARGVIDAQTLGVEAGQTIVLRGTTYGINSTSVDETNTNAATFSIDASIDDDAEIHAISSGSGSGNGSGSGT